MAAPRDPWRNYKYRVSIGGFVRAGFTKISGLERETEIIKYREGGMNETEHKLPGQTKFTELTFERGVTSDTDFVSWAKLIFDTKKVDGFQGPEEGWRRTIVIDLVGKDGASVRRWHVVNCWPSKTKIADLQSDGNDVLIETMEVAHEGFTEESLV